MKAKERLHKIEKDFDKIYKNLIKMRDNAVTEYLVTRKNTTVTDMDFLRYDKATEIVNAEHELTSVSIRMETYKNMFGILLPGLEYFFEEIDMEVDFESTENSIAGFNIVNKYHQIQIEFAAYDGLEIINVAVTYDGSDYGRSYHLTTKDYETQSQQDHTEATSIRNLLRDICYKMSKPPRHGGEKKKYTKLDVESIIDEYMNKVNSK